MQSSDVRNGLQAIFVDVREYLLGEGRTALQAQGKNPKGDTQLAMDKRADEMAVERLRSLLGSFQLFSEEQGVVQIGENPKLAVIIDPVDGSTNFARGVRATGFAVGIMDGVKLDLSKLRYALFGDVFHGDVYWAARGEGATKNGEPIQGSARKTMRGAIMCLNGSMHQHTIIAKQGVTRGVAGMRWCGAAVLDTGYVADGGYDCFLELRGGLTPENFAATTLVIQEAGGVVTDRFGKPFGEMQMTHGSTVIAAGNPFLHSLLIDRLATHLPPARDARKAAQGMISRMVDALKKQTTPRAARRTKRG